MSSSEPRIMGDLENRIEKIESRNKRVENEKAWETSWTRRILLALLTYAVITSFLVVLKNEKPFINALIPAVGFLLSTLALGWAKQLWQKL